MVLYDLPGVLLKACKKSEDWERKQSSKGEGQALIFCLFPLSLPPDLDTFNFGAGHYRVCLLSGGRRGDGNVAESPTPPHSALQDLPCRL